MIPTLLTYVSCCIRNFSFELLTRLQNPNISVTVRKEFAPVYKNGAVMGFYPTVHVTFDKTEGLLSLALKHNSTDNHRDETVDLCHRHAAAFQIITLLHQQYIAPLHGHDIAL